MDKHILATEWLTTRDVSLLPGYGRIASRSLVKIDPFIYSAPMDRVTGLELTTAMVAAGEFPVVSRSTPERDSCLSAFLDNSNVFFAIGFDDTHFLHKAIVLTKSGINVALDIAHGDMARAHKHTKHLRANPLIRNIMSGSICTIDAACRAVEHGCTHLRIGVGPGAACTTRLKTGVGAPNLSAVYRIHKHLEDMGMRDGVALIADGGITEPGDAVKYLAAGADAIMMGSTLSKTRESAGWENDGDAMIKS
ncbi:IMP dehydrogenase, partial [bacterium]|nr:IMP dehydrogenase [bacterium]